MPKEGSSPHLRPDGQQGPRSDPGDGAEGSTAFRRGRTLKLVYALAFLCNGGIFLLVSLAFYSDITELLTSADQRAGWDTPSFWDLALVLRMVRVIFIIVGVLLTTFGVGAAVLWLKRPGRGEAGPPGSGTA